MKDFSYAAAGTVDEAVSLLAAGGPGARVLAGGTDIIVQLREGMRDADLIVDVKKIPELMRVDWLPGGGAKFGAAVPCYQLYDDERFVGAFTGITDAAHIIGGWQVQGRASIGGNLCNSSPAADSIPALIAYSAKCHIAGPGGARTVPVEEFCTSPGRNQLARGEFLVSLELPAQPKHSGGSYLRFIPRNEMDIAVAGAGAWVRLDATGQKIEEARLGLAAVAPTPLYAKAASAWLGGKPATSENFQAAGAEARKIARPIDDRRGTAEYRTHLVGVLVEQALAIAVERAKANK